MRYLLDCDPGVDDTLAILYLCFYKAKDILAITTTAGNTTHINAFRNARYVLSQTKCSDIEVCRSEGKTLSSPVPVAEYVHGRGGLGSLFKEAGKIKDTDDTAISHLKIVETIKKYRDELILIATGPLTNLALAENLVPGILGKTKILWMGGGLKESNITEFAEFNAHFDPLSVKTVFSSAREITMVPLDITNPIKISKQSFFSWIENRSKGEWFEKLLKQYISFSRGISGKEEFNLHDPVAVFCAIHPDRVWKERGCGDIILKGKRRGKFIFKENKKGNIHLVKGIDKKYFFKTFERCIKNF